MPWPSRRPFALNTESPGWGPKFHLDRGAWCRYHQGNQPPILMNNTSKILGTANELLMAVGAALITYGVNVTNSQVEVGAGLLLAVLSLVLTVTRHQGVDLIKSSVRKVLSAGGGAAVAFGVMTPEKVEALMAILAPVLAIVWSVTDKGEDHPPVGLPVIFVLCAALGFTVLPSCSHLGGGGLEFTPDGCILKTYVDENSGSYKAGFCVNEQGKVNRAVVQWENTDGQEIRLTVSQSKQVVIQYRPALNAPWISWDEKSGVVIGPFPASVRPALDGESVSPGDLVPVDTVAVPVLQ